MPRKQQQLAKLTRPRLHNAVARERLFALLDDAREHRPAICVVGPPGAGKTTLVASWLDSKKMKGIWYQVDPGDSDLATFFYYVSEAARQFARKGHRALPVLTPEYFHDVEGFARRFFRELFSRMPPSAVFVLDNYQEIPADSPLHALIVQAIEEMPTGMTMVMVSRRDPPECCARLIANARVSRLEWATLKFTLEETSSLKTVHVGVSDEFLKRIHDLSDGWAAGLTLLLSDLGSITQSSGHGLSGREALFAYFADQILRQLPQPTREFLVITAMLSQVPVSLASAITANNSAGEILEDLFRRHLFTHRRGDQENVYWYHALFREFLTERASTVLGTDGLRLARHRAAIALEARGEFEEAFRLYSESGDWHAASRLTESAAEVLLAGGRSQTLQNWILSLPAQLLEERVFLRYWLGVSLLQTDPRDARRHLETAAARFFDASDLDGQALSIAAIINSYFYEWADFRPLRDWVNKLESLAGHARFDERPDLSRKLHTSLLAGMLYAAPGHPQLPRVVERMTHFLDDEMDANTRITMAVILLSYCNLTCDMERGRDVVARCGTLADAPKLTPLNQLWWQLRLGCHLALDGKYARAGESLDRAIDLCETHGFRGLRGTFLLIASYRLTTDASQGNLTEARKWYQRMVSYSNPIRPMDAWHLDESRVELEMLIGNYRLVAELGERAILRTIEAGMIYAEIQTLVNWGIGRAVLGDSDSFTQAIAKLRATCAGTCFGYFKCAADLLETYFLLEHGDRGLGRLRLAEALKAARVEKFMYPESMRIAVIAPELFAEALRSGIESEYVIDTICRLQTLPPANAGATWPWPLKIRTLGGFEVWCDGRKLDFSGKVPRKPLALLKALIAYGGRNVAEYRIADALWPGEDADLAAKSLDVNLVRLKKLLGYSHAVILHDDVLSLNPDLCSIDVWSFEKSAEQAMRATHPDATTDKVCEALDLYRGEFLPADAAAPWTLKSRERLRGVFLRLVEHEGKRLEVEHQWERAIDCYECGLKSDDLAETFYQGLMRCYRELDWRTEAMATYRKLRQMLSVVLGMAPSESTQALARTLQAESPAPPG